MKFFIAAEDKGANETIIAVCAMFFAWGVSSSMVFSLLPIYIVDQLGGSSKQFGLLEGAVIFFAFLSKLFAGLLIDILRKNLKILWFGTLLTILSRIFFVFAGNIFLVFIAKAWDRFSKGFRAAPSDAILAKISTKYGFAYSLKYMSNILGSLTGSFIICIIVNIWGQNFKLIFALAVIPTVFAYIILQFFVKYGEDQILKTKKTKKLSIKDMKNLSSEYWQFIIFASILMFARFSEGFITLRSKEILPDMVASFPMFMVLYEICSVILAITIGKISDRIDKRKIMLFGVMVLLFTDINAIFASGLIGILLIYMGAGIHMGMTHGILYSIIAETADKRIIGTAFAIYYGIEGVCLFISNYIAGASGKFVSDVFNLSASSGPFALGIVATFCAALYLIHMLRGNISNRTLGEGK